MSDKISVVINTYNAEGHLRRVLDSVRDFDEVVVCDMESTDCTVAIAKEYGCRVVTFPKGEHKICEPARDFAVHSARSEWVLVVDADEVVPAALRCYLYERIAEPGFESALAVARQNLFMGRPETGSPDYQLRFFQRDKCTWPATIHSRPHIDGPVENIPAGRRDLYLIHLDDPTIASRIDKINRYTDYEVSKRAGRQYGPMKLLFRPVWFFVRSYILGGGFRDGRRGLLRAYMKTVYQMTLLSKITEQQLKDKD